MFYTNAKSCSVPQQNFRFLTVAARFPVHDEVSAKARKPSRDRQDIALYTTIIYLFNFHPW
ncbi:hypothetical protein, partial [Legionella shakespearei]|uniref:hypothetical protein n=1 Tax=Legionella shakespearei TaxID=45075 RepID=UPI001ED9A284